MSSYSDRDVLIKRKRNGGAKKEETKISGIEIRDDDTDEGSESDSVECWKFWRESGEPPKIPLKDYTHSPPAYGQGVWYLCIVLLIGIFIYFVNSYNAKQLERIKEEYGMDLKPPVPELWWQHALSHNIIVRSFRDTNSDGIGDLKGVTMNINYFLYLGVDAIILSRILPSPFVDFGRDATDFMSIDPVYGTMEDFRMLIHEFHQNNIKVMLSFNPNHTSRKHKYFEASRRKEKGYENHYVWHPGKLLANGTRVPPNNWMSRYGGSAWSFDPVRNEYYYHHYHANMPDLNYRCGAVASGLHDILVFWMKHGVDGFVMEGANLFFEVDDLDLDEPEVDEPGFVPGTYESLQHVYTVNQHDVHDLTIIIRDWIDQYSVQNNLKVALILHVEEENSEDILKYYETGAHASISRSLMEIDGGTDGRDLYDIVDSYIARVPPDRKPIWMMSDPDTGILNSKTGLLHQNVLMLLLLMLPGASISYMGEELALQALPFSALPEMYQTPQQKIAATCMTPMPWNRFANGGFSKVKPWMPTRSDCTTNNVEFQMQEKSRIISPIQLYGKLARLRKEYSFMLGETQYGNVDENIYSFMRFATNNAPYMVVVNIGNTATTMDLTLTAGVQYGKVMAYALPVTGENQRKSFKEDQTIDLHAVTLRPGEGLVLLLLFEVIMDMNAYM